MAAFSEVYQGRDKGARPKVVLGVQKPLPGTDRRFEECLQGLVYVTFGLVFVACLGAQLVQVRCFFMACTFGTIQ